MPGLMVGCRSEQEHRRQADRSALGIIQEKQQAALGRTEPFTIETPAESLRKRLLLDQQLPYASQASLGTASLEPTPNWPKDDYLDPATRPPATMPAGYSGPVLRMSLVEALQIAAQNSRDYQSRKEQVFQAAMGLELQRDQFRTTFRALMSSNVSASWSEAEPQLTSRAGATPKATASRRFKNGADVTANIALDLAKLLTAPHKAAYGVLSDLSVSMPLMRGAGQHIVTEGLTQAEREVIYSLLEFEQYKRQFAVNIASGYLNVLQTLDQLRNAEDSYKRLVIQQRRSRRMADAGRMSEVEYDQALQQELSARDSWIRSQQQYASQLDSFKVLLGLPPDCTVELDPQELIRLADAARAVLRRNEAAAAAAATTMPSTFPAADAPVELRRPTRENAGRYELSEEEAIRLALANRPDLIVAQGEVYDAQRRVVIAADALKPGLNIGASGNTGGRANPTGDDVQFDPKWSAWNFSLDLDLPLERTREQNAYRSSLISLESSVRSLQQLEDNIKLSIRNQLRSMLQNRESLQTQARAVEIARRRVDSTDLLLQAGRVAIRDYLDAQTALVNAQNDLSQALVNYRVAELRLQQDLGVLQVNHEGLWQEYIPGSDAGSRIGIRPESLDEPGVTSWGSAARAEAKENSR